MCKKVRKGETVAKKKKLTSSLRMKKFRYEKEGVCVCVKLILALPDPGPHSYIDASETKKVNKQKFHAFNMETNILTMTQPDINVFSLSLSLSPTRQTPKNEHINTRTQVNIKDIRCKNAQIKPIKEKPKLNYTHISIASLRSEKSKKKYTYIYTITNVCERRLREQQPEKTVSAHTKRKIC